MAKTSGKKGSAIGLDDETQQFSVAEKFKLAYALADGHKSGGFTREELHSAMRWFREIKRAATIYNKIMKGKLAITAATGEKVTMVDIKGD